LSAETGIGSPVDLQVGVMRDTGVEGEKVATVAEDIDHLRQDVNPIRGTEEDRRAESESDEEEAEVTGEGLQWVRGGVAELLQPLQVNLRPVEVKVRVEVQPNQVKFVILEKEGRIANINV